MAGTKGEGVLQFGYIFCPFNSITKLKHALSFCPRLTLKRLMTEGF